MSKLSPKLDETNVSHLCKCIIQSCEAFMYFIYILYKYALFKKYVRIKINNQKILVLMSKLSPKLK